MLKCHPIINCVFIIKLLFTITCSSNIPIKSFILIFLRLGNTHIYHYTKIYRFGFVPNFLSIGLAKEYENGYVVPNANFLLMSNGGFACKTGASVYGKVDGNTVYWYNNSSSEDLQLNTVTYKYAYIAIG